jgi:anti-sigma factor RsiW
MNCQSCQELMQQRLDGSPADAADLDRHLADCPACAALHAASLRLGAGLRLLSPPAPPVGLTNRILAAVLEEERVARKRRRVRAAVLALAACLLLGTTAFALYYAGVLKSGNTATQPVVQRNQPKPPEPAPPAASAPSVRESMSEAGSALATLTTRTADETVGQTRLLVPVVTGPTLDELDMPPALEPTKSYFEAGQGVSVALKPLTSSARRAVDLFRRDLPHVEPAPNP